jgi:hypothetical protein
VRPLALAGVAVALECRAGKGCYECNDVNKPVLCTAAALGAGLLLIAGCARGGGDDFPTGEWSNTRGYGGERVETVAAFRPDGTWELSRGPTKNTNILTQLTSGLYSSTEGVLTFAADSACEALHYGIEPGTYTWTFENEQLTLTPLHEPCVERRGAIGGLTFSRLSGTDGAPTGASG